MRGIVHEVKGDLAMVKFREKKPAGNAELAFPA